ncbi:DUF742 domain-containing protein [Nocardia mexicana]|uniref:Uncharacterized protein DUF742 n=1 Tax=Nocardia mexicana TaxID=279262 RepID=A0A370HGS7_9NOCA|nr:DUF742 domain-containing protein [Nocardia mexicana]RDI55986.1 uncharacterized protein DUF742 [Nocardia mexicana]
MTRHPDDPWPPDDPGPLVRPFAVTRGRAHTAVRDLDLLTLVSAVGPDAGTLDREYREILRLCAERPLSVAEIAAHLGLFVAAAKVLVGDLITAGYVTFHSPAPPDYAPDPELLRAVLEGIRRI